MDSRPTPASRPTAEKTPSPYEKLKHAIIGGELAPGQQLVETTLATWCGVSRTPIREALTRLEQDGLVLRTDRGVVVRKRSPEEILDIYEIRVALEAMVARNAAARRNALDILQLKGNLETLLALNPEDAAAMAAASSVFHRTVRRASHNEPLIEIVDRLNTHISARYPTTLSQPGRWGEANEEHRVIFESIERQDGDRAASEAAAHFTTARDLRLAMWASERETMDDGVEDAGTPTRSTAGVECI
jgi:DNA-binding GntR family transcriptional regulator